MYFNNYRHIYIHYVYTYHILYHPPFVHSFSHRPSLKRLQRVQVHILQLRYQCPTRARNCRRWKRSWKRPTFRFPHWPARKVGKKGMKLYLVIQSDLFGMVKWPFKGLSDLQLEDQKVTLNHLVHGLENGDETSRKTPTKGQEKLIFVVNSQWICYIPLILAPFGLFWWKYWMKKES